MDKDTDGLHANGTNGVDGVNRWIGEKIHGT